MRTARDLSARLADLLQREHLAMADFLLALAAFHRRRCWADLGHAGLWYFLHRELGLSAGAASQRKAAAELLCRCPEAIEPLRDGRLCLSSLIEVAKVLTPENRAEVLPRFFHCSAREAREITAALCPMADPPMRAVVTPLARVRHEEAPVLTSELAATQPPGPAPAPVRSADLTSTQVAAPPAAPSSTPAPAAAHPRATTEPLTADLHRLHLTVSRRFLAKLQAARGARSHARPGASTEALLEEALDLLLDREARRRGQGSRRRRPASRRANAPDQPSVGQVDDPAPPPPNPSQVPAALRAEVWSRDQGRCQWPIDSGGVCGSTWQLELDHILPRARGGPCTAANLRVLCRSHNLQAARQAYGATWMSRFTGQATSP